MAWTEEQRQDYIRGARERVALMSAEQKADLMPVVRWMALEIEKVKQRTR